MNEAAVLSEFKCLETVEHSVCSRCLGSGFTNRAPAFYRFDDTTSIYICDDCHDVCYKGGQDGWHHGKLEHVPKIPDFVSDSILAKQQAMAAEAFKARQKLQ